MSERVDTSSTAGRLLVISGPSGSGKSTIIRTLRDHPQVEVSVSVTTRRPREGEVDGRDYHFVERDEFMAMHRDGRFIETNDVFGNGNLYGSLKSELDEALARPGLVYVMEVDVDGAHNIRAAGYDGTYVYIAPPSPDELARRLRGRATDDEAEIARRLGRAAKEERQAGMDGSRIVVNETVEQAVDEILGLVKLARQPH
ncbi:MAG: guanylate kinase [Planctomycetes bacterium]|nr:guanylate kinase [Planctomycetota bacterium]